VTSSLNGHHVAGINSDCILYSIKNVGKFHVTNDIKEYIQTLQALLATNQIYGLSTLVVTKHPNF
jgi:hypothetical protein